MHKQAINERIEALARKVESTGKAVALFGLGSTGKELARLDEYSDIDFFVIVRSLENKQWFLQSLDWLQEIFPLGYYFKNTTDGYKIMFADGIYAEFAIFDESELVTATFSDARIIWAVSDFDATLAIPKNTGSQPWKPESVEWLIGEILTCVYVGLCRYRRGELLSGYTFIQRHAFLLIIELIYLTVTPESGNEDIFSKERRFEERYPKESKELGSLLTGYNALENSAKGILNFLEKRFTLSEFFVAKINELCDK